MKNSYQRIRLVREYVLLAAASVKLLGAVIQLVNMAFNYPSRTFLLAPSLASEV